jgi:hypothetical protein
MVDRRAYLASVGTALTAATAGCGFILGDEPATFSASAAEVPDSTQEETGYQFKENAEMEVEREFSVADQSRKVVATNVLAKHEKSISLPVLGDRRAGVFTALTTPKVEVLGETFNPIEDMVAKELAKMVQNRYSGFENVQQESQSQIQINGNTTQQVKFSSNASLAGDGMDIYLHISEAVGLGDDFLITFGSYPQNQADEEEPNILALMKSVQS